MRLDYIRLLVQNFDECYRFYRDIMEFPVTWGLEGENYASFKAGPSTTLSIFKRNIMAEILGTSNRPSDANSQDTFLLIFGTADVDEMTAKLKKRGAAFIFDPTDNPRWGIRTAYLRDPDGNLIEINSPMPKEEWSDELKAESDSI